MSTAPLCRLCKTRHWGMCPRNEVTTDDIVTKIEAKKLKKVVTTPKIVTNEAEKEVTTVTTPEDIRKARQREKSAKWRKANREKYNSYMSALRMKSKYAHLENLDGDGI